MKARALNLALITAALGVAVAPSALADIVLYSNNSVTGQMAAASRPASAGKIGIQAADDFVLAGASSLTSGSFIGMVTGGGSINVVGIEIYRVFPLDSTVP